MSADINDDDLESLMAELEAQNAELAASTPIVVQEEPEPAVAPKVEVKAEPEPEVESSFDPAELEALEGLEVNLAPTPGDKLDADQTTDLESVFEEAATVELEAVAPTIVEVEPIPEVVAEPIQEVVTEPVAESVIEPIETPAVEPMKLNIAPQPATTKPISAKQAEEAFELKYEPDVKRFQLETSITDATLDQCMMDQASRMAYHTALHAKAEAQLARAKQKFNILEAGLYDAYRKDFLKQGEKVTEKAIENAVRLDTKWAKAHLLVIEAQTYADMHKGFVASLRDRRDMLIQRGADRREEMKGQVRTVQSIDPESPMRTQERQESNSMASKAMELARASMSRS